MGRSSLTPVRVPRNPTDEAASRNGSPARILIIEDERIVAADLQRLLRKLGYDAYGCAATASRAWALAAETSPDVVLADIRIEGPVDGVDAAFEIRRRQGAAIVFLTAHADDLTVERAKYAEPNGYLVKPISATAVRAAIEMALDRRAREASLQALELALTETTADLVNAFNHLPLGILLEDSDGRVLHINPAFRALFGMAEDRLDVIGSDAASLVERVRSLCQDQETSGAIIDCLQHAQQPIYGDVITLADGRRLEVDCIPVLQGRKPSGRLWAYRDISVSERAREELEQSAARHRQEILVDPLTGLASRRGFFQLSPTYMKLVRCTGEQKRILFFVDVDGLKAINDRYGHAAGDEAICAVAQALRGTFQTSDLVARLGGDEFVVLATMTLRDSETVRERLAVRLAAFSESVAPPYRLEVSVGLAEHSAGESLDALISRADEEMYRDKRAKPTRALPGGA
jgi:diguanylate cyclase (GGDEF)-like protein/PAS domain S-box-containing protein